MLSGSLAPKGSVIKAAGVDARRFEGTARVFDGEDGAMERTVHLSYGDRRGSEYVNEVATDLLIHGWDLARAIGADEAMDAELVRHVYEQTEPHTAGLKASGLFGPEVTPPEGADRQTELLAIFGRVA